MTAQIRTATGWRDLGATVVGVREDRSMCLRGLQPRQVVRLGPVELAADDTGALECRLSDQPLLKLQLGRLIVEIDDGVAGEIDVRPGKLTDEAYRVLREDLERTWTHLALREGAATSAVGAGPDPVDLWFELGPAVEALRQDPPTVLGFEEGYLQLARVRRPSALTPAMVAAHHRGRPGRTRLVRPVVDESARALTRDCLQRLHALAVRHPRGAGVAVEVTRFLTRPPFDRSHTGVVRPTHAIRCDPYLQQVLAVRRQLGHREATPIEGPGEARSGVKAIDRLYEYWVYLQLLLAAEARYGPPVGEGYRSLARRVAGDHLRLELAPGTTVEFPGGVHLAFEPSITMSGRGSWMDLAAAANPIGHTQTTFTPDVVVLHRGTTTRAVVIDAKYRVRHAIDRSLAETHIKYGRLTHDGTGIVGTVVVAHPHAGLRLSYAGMLAAPFVPGEARPQLPWPSARPTPAQPPAGAAAGPAYRGSTRGTGGRTWS